MREVYSTDRNTNRERIVVEVESSSRPGLTYRVHLGPQTYCRCESRYFHPSRDCCHITEARVRTAPYRMERRHNSIIGLIEYAVVEQATGQVEGFYASHLDAAHTLMDLSGIGRRA